MTKQVSAAARTREFFTRHQFATMLVGAVVIALILVYIALLAYDRSDASSLDLSHPDYQPLRSQITTDKANTFSGTGVIDEKFLNEFDKLFAQQASEATEIDAFGGNVLSDEALGISQE